MTLKSQTVYVYESLNDIKAGAIYRVKPLGREIGGSANMLLLSPLADSIGSPILLRHSSRRTRLKPKKIQKQKPKSRG